MEVNKYVGNKIKYYRNRMGMNQTELGKKLGVAQNTVSGYEKGDWQISYDDLFLLVDIFDIKVDDLFPATSSEDVEDDDSLHRALELSESKDLDLDDMLLIKRITEKALSLESAERKRLMDSIRFAADYFDK